MAICSYSGFKHSVSDHSLYDKKAICPVCQQKVRITIPDKDMHANVAKFVKHTV